MLSAAIRLAGFCVIVSVFTLAPPTVTADESKTEWLQLMRAEGNPTEFKVGGGKHYFTIDASAKVQFQWDVNPNGRGSNFRAVLARQNKRTGSYNIIGTIATVHAKASDTIDGKLEPGKYQIYIVAKRTKYVFTVSKEKEK